MVCVVHALCADDSHIGHYDFPGSAHRDNQEESRHGFRRYYRRPHGWIQSCSGSGLHNRRISLRPVWFSESGYLRQHVDDSPYSPDALLRQQSNGDSNIAPHTGLWRRTYSCDGVLRCRYLVSTTPEGYSNRDPRHVRHSGNSRRFCCNACFESGHRELAGRHSVAQRDLFRWSGFYPGDSFWA